MKDNIDKAKYQESFLPIVSKMQMGVKLVVIKKTMEGAKEKELREILKSMLLKFSKTLPPKVIDRKAYIIGMKNFAEKQIQFFYAPIKKETTQIMTKIQQFLPKTTSIKPIDVSPKEVIETYKDKIEALKYSRKGFPNIENYEQKVRARVKELAQSNMSASEGKRKINIYQKAQLDVRYEGQMQMLKEVQENARETGEVYYYCPKHADESIRCSRWSGKIFDVLHDADNGEFKMKRKINGKNVYSLKAIKENDDRFGKTEKGCNTIIFGYNCRHHLEKLTEDGVLTEHFSKEDLERERKINAQLRAMENQIRKYKTEANCLEASGLDKAQVKVLRNKAKALKQQYEKLARDNGFAIHPFLLIVDK